MVSLNQKDQSIIVKVRDSGIGIPENQLPFIFDRFYQVDKRSEGGSGIGLSIVKEFVELMHGKVGVASTIKEGTLFTITLPITALAKEKEFIFPEVVKSKNAAPSLVDEGEKIVVYKKQILLIEDNHDVAFYIKQILKEKYQVDHLLNGKEGLKEAMKTVPDLIISDIMMPDMDGIEMTRKLKDNINTSHIPVILLTAKATEQDKLEGLQAGALAYLTKPFNEEELTIRMKTILQDQEKLQHYFAVHQVLPSSHSLENTFLEQVHDAIHDHLDDHNFGIQELCAKVNLERTQVYRKIKALTGLSTSQLIKDIRLLEAKKMLQKSNKAISEIAYDCGFKDVSYFSKVFKGKFGTTPSKIKKS